MALQFIFFAVFTTAYLIKWVILFSIQILKIILVGETMGKRLNISLMDVMSKST